MRTGKRLHKGRTVTGAAVVTVVVPAAPDRRMSVTEVTETYYVIHKGCAWPLWMLN